MSRTEVVEQLYKEHGLQNRYGHPHTVQISWFPRGLEKLENLEKLEGIFQSGKSEGIFIRLEKSGNLPKILEKSRNFNTGKWE